MKYVLWFVGIFVGLGILFGTLDVLGVYGNAAAKTATAPARVLDKTMDTENIITSYEKFRDTYTAYESKIEQIKSDSAVKPSSKDDADNLAIEIRGEKQACRDLVASYNADAIKTNKNIFKNPPAGGPVLPDHLDLGACN